jgi:hypothetical protein
MMKYLLAIALLLTSCTVQPAGNYTGQIVEMTHNTISRGDSKILIFISEMKQDFAVYDSPYFDQLNIGDRIQIGCTKGFFGKCYVIGKVK